MKENKNFLAILLSVIAFIGNKLGIFLTWYKKIWLKYTHNKYDEFVYKRGISVAIATVATVIIVPMILCLILHTAYYFATYHKETIYLNHSEEIYPDENIWGVRGCETTSCDSECSLYFRISPAIFHHLWSLTHHGRVFIPDAIGSSVPTGLTQCEVISYGLRFRMTRLFNIYPNILSVSCLNSFAN